MARHFACVNRARPRSLALAFGVHEYIEADVEQVVSPLFATMTYRGFPTRGRLQARLIPRPILSAWVRNISNAFMRRADDMLAATCYGVEVAKQLQECLIRM